MDERQFEALAAQALNRIERALDESGIDADVELKEGGVLELEFDNGSKIIVNRRGTGDLGRRALGRLSLPLGRLGVEGHARRLGALRRPVEAGIRPERDRRDPVGLAAAQGGVSDGPGGARTGTIGWSTSGGGTAS